MPSTSLLLKIFITLRVEALKVAGRFIKNESMYKGGAKDKETKSLKTRLVVSIRRIFGTWTGERARHTPPPQLSLIILRYLSHPCSENSIHAEKNQCQVFLSRR